MRISTSILYERGTSSMTRLQEQLLTTQDHLSSGRRVLIAADDPSAAAQVLASEQSLSINAQHQTNIGAARSALSQQETALGAAVTAVQGLRALAVSAGNPGLSPAELRAIAGDVRERYDTLLAHANARDGQGRYVFSGLQVDTAPFVSTGPGTVAFQGDQGRRSLQVDASRSIAISDSAQQIFFTTGADSKSVFEVADAFASALEAASGSQDAAAALNDMLTDLDAVFERMVASQSSIGARLRELDSLQGTAEDREVQYRQQISEQRDVDYAAAITELTKQRYLLEASQQSFQFVSGLSLFRFL